MTIENDEDFNISKLAMNLRRLSNGKINSVSRYVEKLQELEHYLKHNDESSEDYELFFRGHGNRKWISLPSITRENFIQNEDTIFRELISTMPEEFVQFNSTFQKLVKMQHYGLPTRLLDITGNPLVALYFACESVLGENQQEQEGEIVIYKIPKKEIKYYDSDTVSILSNIAKMKSDFVLGDTSKMSVEEFCNLKPIKLLLHEIRQEKNGFLPDINPSDLSRVLCVKPLLENQRIIRQDGAFLLFGMGKQKDDFVKLSSEYRLSRKNLRFIITAESKKEILKELSVLGFHHAKLFPEIDKIASHIKQRFQ